MHPLLQLFLMLVGFLVAMVASALTVAYGSWIPYALFMGAFSSAVYIKSKDRKTIGEPVSQQRRDRAMQEYVEEAKKKQ
jgi:hypothetical protein